MDLAFAFLIYPLAAFVISLKRIKSKDFYIVFFLMSVFLAFLIKLQSDEVFNGDITRYIKRVGMYHSMGWEEIFLDKDYFIPVVTKILSYISLNERFVMVCYYLIFTGFYLSSFRLITRYAEIQNNSRYYFLLLAILIVYPFSQINGLRFAMATVYYVWCALELIINNKKKFYIYILMAPLIHFSYWIFVSIPFLHLLLRKRLNWAIAFLIASSFLSSSTTAFRINNIADDLFNESTVSTLKGYTSEDGLSMMNERYLDLAKDGNFNRALSRNMLDIRNYGIMGLLLIMAFHNRKKIITTEKLQSRLTYLLTVFSVANLAASASNGDRFYHTSVMIAIFLFYYMLYDKEKNINDYSFLQRNRKLIYLVLILAIINSTFTIIIAKGAFSYINLFSGNLFTATLL